MFRNVLNIFQWDKRKKGAHGKNDIEITEIDLNEIDYISIGPTLQYQSGRRIYETKNDYFVYLYTLNYSFVPINISQYTLQPRVTIKMFVPYDIVVNEVHCIIVFT